MDTKMIGSFLKELRKENNMTQEQLGERIGVTKVLGELEGDYKKFEKRMIIILIINAILAISIITLLPLKSWKDIAIFIMVLAMAFLSNVVNMVAIGAKKESMR